MTSRYRATITGCALAVFAACGRPTLPPPRPAPPAPANLIGEATASKANRADDGEISGTVVDPQQHQRLSDATLVAIPVGGGNVLTAITDADGAFRFGDVVPGVYGLTVYYCDVSTDQPEIHVRAGFATTITLFLIGDCRNRSDVVEKRAR